MGPVVVIQYEGESTYDEDLHSDEVDNVVDDDSDDIYGRKSADRTKPHFDVIFFVFLNTFFGNLKVCYAKTCNIF